jgi:methylmalonyl-CoA mutase N-terminal domain/subunit
LAQRRAERDEPAVQAALQQLSSSASGTENLLPPMLAAVRVEATLGEICGALRELWGSYFETPSF